METFVHNIRDLTGNERSAVEQLVGHALRDNQRVIIQVMTVGTPTPEETESSQATTTSTRLPDYCNVYDGLSDEEVAQLESLILDRSPSRSTS